MPCLLDLRDEAELTTKRALFSRLLRVVYAGINSFQDIARVGYVFALESHMITR